MVGTPTNHLSSFPWWLSDCWLGPIRSIPHPCPDDIMGPLRYQVRPGADLTAPRQQAPEQLEGSVTLYRHGRAVDGFFDLLGDGEVAHTAALGWSLAACEELAAALVNDLTGATWGPLDVSLERRDAEGRTDVELTGESPDRT